MSEPFEAPREELANVPVLLGPNGPELEPAGAIPVEAIEEPVTATRRRRTLRNTLANGASRLVSIGTSFVMAPLILHAVGPNDYALWVLIGSVVAYASLLDLGVGGAITKFVAEYRAVGDGPAARRTVSTGLRLYLGLGAVTAVLGLVLAPFVPALLDIPPEQAGLAVGTTVLMAIGLGVAIPCTTASAALRGLHRYDVTAAIAIVGSLLALALTWLVLELGFGILGVVAIGIPVPIATQVLAVVAVRRFAPELVGGDEPMPAAAEPRADAARGSARTLVRFSWPLFLLDVAGRLQSKTDEIVVALTVSLGSVTPYSLGRKLATIPRLVAEQFAANLLPLASELDARNERDRLRSLYTTGVRISLAIAVPLTACLILLSGPILDAWVGPGYESGAPIVVILAVATAVDLSLWPAGFVLQGIARHRWLAPISLLSGIANLVLSVALAGQFGLVGVAVGTLIPSTVEALILTPYTLRKLDLPASRFAARSLAPAVLPALPAILAIVVLEQLLSPSSLLAIAVLVVIAHIVYGAIYLALPPARPERRLAGELAATAASALSGAGRR